MAPTTLAFALEANTGFQLVSMYYAAAAAAAKSLQSCLTLRDPIDGSAPGSAIPGILQARMLEWVAISIYRHKYIDLYLTTGE